MNKLSHIFLHILALGGAALSTAAAEPMAASAGSECREAALAAETAAGLPQGLLLAIGKVETGRPNPVTGRVDPWPWSTNLGGAGHYFASASDAIAWTSWQMSQGERSIDVGCFQVNLKFHPAAFASLQEAFNPAANARYAAVFLNALHDRLGDWQLAAAQYHSADPALGSPYGSRVFALLDDNAAREARGASAPRLQMAAFHVPAVDVHVQVFVPAWATAQAAFRPSLPLPQPGGGTFFRRSVLRLPRVYTPS